MFSRIACVFRRNHDYELRRGDAQVYLECRHYGVRTHGWDVGTRFYFKPAPSPRQLSNPPAQFTDALPLDDSHIKLTSTPPLTDSHRSEALRSARSIRPLHELRLLLDE